MKRYVWIVALLAALALVVAGCENDSGTSTYTVTFDKNTTDTVSGMPANQKVSKDSYAAAPAANPFRGGYTFVGWYKEATGVNVWDFYNDIVDSNKILYAKWAEGGADFTRIDLGDFTVVTTGNANQMGWASNGYDDLVTDLAIEDLLAAEFLILELGKAPSGGMQLVWQGKGEGVNETAWNQNDILSNVGVPDAAKGVTLDSNNVLSISLPTAFATSDIGKLTYADFLKSTSGAKIILGYYTGGIAGLEILEAYLLLPPRTTPLVKYTVIFDVDGDTEFIPSIEVTENFSMGAQYPQDPVKAGSVFGEWIDKADSDKVYTSDTPITANITLTATWLVEHTVTFDTGTGGPVVAAITVGDGRGMGTAYPVPVLAGYDFDGWFVDPTDDTTEYDKDEPITADITLIALWTKLHTVTFKKEATDTTAVDTATVRNGEALADDQYPTPNPTKESTAVTDFIFDGWYDTTLTTQYDADDAAIPITADITLVVKWRETTVFTVSFFISSTDTTAYATREVEQGTSIGATQFPANPTKGYSAFTGWNAGSSAFTATTVVNADTTVIAQWTEPLEFTPTLDDKWWLWGGNTIGSTVSFEGNGLVTVNFPSSTNLADYEAVLFKLTVVDKSTGDGFPALMAKTWDDTASSGNEAADTDAINILQDGEWYIGVSGDSFAAVIAAGGLGFQPDTYNGNDGTYDITFVSGTLVPKSPAGTYGAQTDGSYILNHRNFGWWYRTSLAIDTIQFFNGATRLTFPGDFNIASYTKLVITYTTSGYTTGTAKLVVADYDGTDYYYPDLAAAGTLTLDLSKPDDGSGFSAGSDGIALKNNTYEGVASFMLNFGSITFVK